MKQLPVSLTRRLAGALFLIAPLAGHAAPTLELSSPDRQLRVTIDTGEQLTLAVQHRATQLVLPTPIGLKLSGIGTLGERPRLSKQQRVSIDNTVRPLVAQKSRQVRDHYNALRLDFAGGYTLEVRAYDEGIAYRFRTELPGQVTVEDELAGVHVRPQDTLYWPQEKSMQSHNEHYYQQLAVSEAAGKLVGVPALVRGGGAHLVLTESGLRDYPGMYLHGEPDGLRAVFPKVALADTARDDRNVPVTQEAPYIARTAGTRSYPWRILGIAADAGGLLLNQMPYLLAEPQELKQTDWIKPGKVAWDWYNGNKLYNVPFKSGLDTRTYRHYIDFAAENGLEYIIMDEGWYELGNLLAVKPEIDMPALMAHAKERGVGIILWVSWKTLDTQMTPALDQFARWGAAGIKVDFMQRADQWMVNYYERVAREAAARKLLVDFHGSFKPSGLQRTWPNVLTFEGVKGLENNKWSDKQTPEHDVTMPFIRMFAGPVDYTPGAMSNAHRKDFVASFDRPMSQGTRAHQLAMYVIYESPLQMLADSPSQYSANPSSLAFIRQVPVEWDESRVLHADLGRYVVMARRRGDSWYVGAMTGSDGRELALDLSFLGEGSYQMNSMEDGPNAAVFATDVQPGSASVTRDSRLTMRLAPGGGWTAIIRPTKQTQ
ncbi:glycoside hydrolase family protein [Janthinobacterium sp. HH01]|uniref:glycoside hydrolase family 97 protein n=1 Tax=Janthinobacterium sp. HH01 TaxID=1198452 RepID=UPI0002AEBFA3|nr:glycoside hydrolase family 97 protein [Janthinobacterium sp. HH01]ELX13765.1 glycoside hydrolase family protein [Janthinobacterium sp. HH01]